MPVTTPPEDIDAIVELLLLHDPPGGVPLSVVVKPAQTLIVPVIEVGNGLTVTTTLVVHPVTGNV